MIIVVIVVIVWLFFCAVIWSCCKVASDADDLSEKIMKNREFHLEWYNEHLTMFYYDFIQYIGFTFVCNDQFDIIPSNYLPLMTLEIKEANYHFSQLTHECN